MDCLFKITYDFLKFLEGFTGFSYREINIIIWFFIIPFSWAVLADMLGKKHYFKISFSIVIALVLLLINDFEEFSNWLFDQSVVFLNLFNGIGSNYTASSVIFCLLIPLLLYIILIRAVIYKKKSK